MQINYIELKNFRQFKGVQRIDFSTDVEKNVTLIIADNTLGKTTVQESFRWAFYGNIPRVKNIDLFNIEKKHSLDYGFFDTSVEVGVMHLGTEYVIIREMSITQVSEEQFKASNPVLEVIYKTKDGLSKKLSDALAQRKVNEIMPNDLFDYFFFDGERIENIGREISTGRSLQFANAVKGMLGFTALDNAMKHLKRVQRDYETQISKVDKGEFGKLKYKITRQREEIEKVQHEINLNDKNLQYYHSEKDRLQEEIMSFSSVEQKQKAINELWVKKHFIKDKQEEITKAILKGFSNKFYNVLARHLNERVNTLLESSTTSDYGIPGINASTIDFLIDREKCICGCCLKKGNKSYDDILETQKYLPPNDVSAEVRVLNSRIESSCEQADSFISDFKNFRTELSDLNRNFSDVQEEIEKLTAELKESPDVGKLKIEEEKVEKQIMNLTLNAGKLEERLNQENEKLKEYIERSERIRPEIKESQELELANRYLTEVYNKIDNFYKKREVERKKRLEDEINNIFSQLFDEKNQIFIKKNYEIEVLNKEYKSSLEKSSSENVSITFSFIAGIIKLAREKVNTSLNKNDNISDDDLMTEPYPLVMDAPLSSFDSTRIEKISTILPSIAEQVIIFIKDTDGYIARQHMVDSIGKEYYFSRVTQSHTKINKGYKNEK